MGKRDRWESDGPSYWDCAEHADWLKDKYGIGVRFLVVPSVPRFDGRGRSAWCVSCQVWRLGGGGETLYASQHSFGAGGAWRTLPSAILQGLLDIGAKLEKAEREAATQAAF